LRHVTWVFARLTPEGRVLWTTLSIAVVFAADIVRTDAHVLVIASASLLLATLLFTRAYRLTGVTAEIHSPPRVTVGEEMTITVSLRNEGDSDHRSIRVQQPFLSRDGSWSAAPARIVKLPAGGRAHTVVRARFVARGEHHLDSFRAVAILPLGLSQGAPLRTENARFLVVPKVARVVSIETTLSRRHQPGGVARASRTGDATELLGVRPYRPGDPVRDLHARLWARHGSPMVREYQEEYFARIGVVVDTDANAATPAHLEAALSLAAGVIARLCRGEALVEVLVAGDRMQKLSLGRSLGSLEQALDILSVVQARPGFDANGILARLDPHIDRLSSVVLIALEWNAARSGLAAALRSRGLDCAVLVVGDSASHAPHARTVALQAIERGEALSL
jgi:uncharacterized protein (DUF58 family)